MLGLLVIVLAGVCLGLTIAVGVLRRQLRFERKWRREEEAQHLLWFERATGLRVDRTDD